jgi:hypothetical protein
VLLHRGVFEQKKDQELEAQFTDEERATFKE